MHYDIMMSATAIEIHDNSHVYLVRIRSAAHKIYTFPFAFSSQISMMSIHDDYSLNIIFKANVGIVSEFSFK